MDILRKTRYVNILHSRVHCWEVNSAGSRNSASKTMCTTIFLRSTCGQTAETGNVTLFQCSITALTRVVKLNILSLPCIRVCYPRYSYYRSRSTCESSWLQLRWIAPHEYQYQDMMNSTSWRSIICPYSNAVVYLYYNVLSGRIEWHL